MNDIRDVFAEPLAVRLGRTAEEIRAEGLGAGDFKTNEGAVVSYDRDSRHRLAGARSLTLTA